MASTLSEYIESGTDDLLTYYNLSVVQQINNIIYSVDNVIYDYIEELRSVAVDVEMTDREFYRYEFRPDLLAFDLYGSTELFFVILAINNLSSPKEFTLKKIKLLPVENCIELINQIYNSEEEYLNISKNSITSEEE